MIIKMIVQTILTIVTMFIQVVNTFIPTVDLTTNLINNITLILNISTQAINFVHFIVGDSIILILPIALGIITYKYVLLPLIDLVRRLIPFVNL